ncbi:unnamed protein product [Peronospora belbahrii]|uniref:Uncharacterized protein n=1 Tax=Peronospora belbahrii TaxID=622444 RepID=A0ABN8CVG9_9STRA|nr:unnamed protein product [Peronospora belbahrii]
MRSYLAVSGVHWCIRSSTCSIQFEHQKAQTPPSNMENGWALQKTCYQVQENYSGPMTLELSSSQASFEGAHGRRSVLDIFIT